jgi:putative flippase GtrA
MVYFHAPLISYKLNPSNYILLNISFYTYFNFLMNKTSCFQLKNKKHLRFFRFFMKMILTRWSRLNIKL